MANSQPEATLIAGGAIAPIEKAARRLQQEAQGHTRLANQHRERAKTLYGELEELRVKLAEFGITLRLHP